MDEKVTWGQENRPRDSQKETKQFDITKTGGYRESMDDVKHGRVTHYDSVDDMFKDILGEEAFRGNTVPGTV